MDYQGWKRSWLFPEDSFYKTLFENNKNFELALENVIDLLISKSIHPISDKELQDLDQDYEERSFSAIFEGLRDIRRAIEAGVIIDLDGRELKSVGAFVTWAHKRYHLLEVMFDKWIGNDKRPLNLLSI
jgi:hypothetical protein